MKSILTPRQFAEAIGVSESSVKRWVDDDYITATRTAGGHRRISIQEATRYIREHATVVVRPDRLGLSHRAMVGGGVSEEAGEQFFEYLRSGAAEEAQSLFISSYLAGRSVAEIIDGPLQYAMSRIGHLWVSNPSGVFWEHRATSIAMQALIRLRLLLSPSADAPSAVGGAPSGDRYVLPSLAVAAVLEGEGIPATHLGADTPISTLALSIEELDPRLVYLSVSVAVDADRLRRQILDLAAKLAPAGKVLVIGGSAASTLALPKKEGLYVGRSMAELEALVKGMKLAPRDEARAG